MKKLISLLGILFLLTLFIPSNHAEAARGSEGLMDRGDMKDFVVMEDMEDSVVMGSWRISRI